MLSYDVTEQMIGFKVNTIYKLKIKNNKACEVY